MLGVGVVLLLKRPPAGCVFYAYFFYSAFLFPNIESSAIFDNDGGCGVLPNKTVTYFLSYLLSPKRGTLIELLNRVFELLPPNNDPPCLAAASTEFAGVTLEKRPPEGFWLVGYCPGPLSVFWVILPNKDPD